MAQPHTAHAGRRDAVALLLELVGDPHLTERRLVDRHLNDGLLDRRIDAVLLDRFPLANFGQRQLAALLVQLLKAVETVAAVSHHLAAWDTLPSCLASSSRPTLALMTFCSVVIVGSRFCAAGCKVHSPSARSLTTGNDAHHFVNIVRSSPDFHIYCVLHVGLQRNPFWK
jgi:hypothetical protein